MEQACTIHQSIQTESKNIPGDYEQEVKSGDEDDLHKCYKSCTKNTGREQFIGVNRIRSEHLPGRYQSDQTLIDLARAQADVTCLIKVAYVSPDRDETAPFFRYRGRRDFSRRGTGWVSHVTVHTEGLRDYKPCPCHTCQRSSEPRSEWAEVRITTAKHVVFDQSEAETSKCYFFYDSDHQKMTDCEVISGPGQVQRVVNDTAGDSSEISYSSHDVVLAKRLKQMYDHYDRLCQYAIHKHNNTDREVEETHDDVRTNDELLRDKETRDDEKNNPDQGLVIITSHPHGSSKKITIGQVTDGHVSDQKDATNVRLELTTPTCPGSSGAPVFLLVKKYGQGGHINDQSCQQRHQKEVTTNERSYLMMKMTLTTSTTAKRKITVHVRIIDVNQSRLEHYRKVRLLLDYLTILANIIIYLRMLIVIRSGQCQTNSKTGHVCCNRLASAGKYKHLKLVMFVLIMTSQSCLAEKFCHRGHILYTPKSGPDICRPCPGGYFMPVQRNNYRKCFPCTSVQNSSVEVLVSDCTRTDDTDIVCIEGYYRTQARYPDYTGECVKCTDCPYPLRPCQPKSDTVCCDSEDFDVFINDQGQPKCVKMCGQGQFLDATSENCLPCPENTYMQVTRHTHSHCLPCDFPKSKHEKMIQACNSTHPVLIGCVDGYYRHISQFFFLSKCVKCQVCSTNEEGHVYEGRACSEFNNTVCCPQPNMTVVDSPEGPECRPTVKLSTVAPEAQISTFQIVCKDGEYLYADPSTYVAKCLPCPNKTSFLKLNNKCKHLIDESEINKIPRETGGRPAVDIMYLHVLVSIFSLIMFLLLSLQVLTYKMYKGRIEKIKNAKYDNIECVEQNKMNDNIIPDGPVTYKMYK